VLTFDNFGGGKAMAKQRHTWFVCPKNAHTNEVVARMHQGGDNRFEEDILVGVECADGIKRNLWRIASFDDAYFLWRSRNELKFNVFAQRGNSKPRDVTEPLFRKERRSPKRKHRV
jgi:hypothetical protein